MKTMTCKQLGGACELKFQAETFEDITDLSKKHGAEMFHKGDKEHLAAMNEMRTLMQSSDAMSAWFENKRKEFLALPED
ncbi:MAG: DUF1059 domain-containing protein [Flavobacteriaceae bacterium]